MTAEILASVSLWAGAFVGILKLVDWSLSARQRRIIASWAATAWIWLDEQRLGKFVSVVRSVRAQKTFSLAAHTVLLIATLLFLGRAFLGWPGVVEIYIGSPRLYLFQVWVDVVAILVSMILLSLVLHPRITGWMARAPSVPAYFVRSGFATGLAYCLMRLHFFVLSILGLPPGQGTIANSQFLGPAMFAAGNDAEYGGPIAVVLIHAVTALIGAPVLTEVLLLIVILIASLTWIATVLVLSMLHLTLIPCTSNRGSQRRPSIG